MHDLNKVFMAFVRQDFYLFYMPGTTIAKANEVSDSIWRGAVNGFRHYRVVKIQ